MIENHIVTQWNTGQLYTVAGQRIGACYAPQSGDKPGFIAFCDMDRQISMIIDNVAPIAGEATLRDYVRTSYNRGEYRWNDNSEAERAAAALANAAAAAAPILPQK